MERPLREVVAPAFWVVLAGVVAALACMLGDKTGITI